METIIKHKAGKTWIETVPGTGMLANENDALDLVGQCGENDTPLLLIRSENLPDAFYDLHTGLAGSALLKFSNYRSIVAAVVKPQLANAGKFWEFALETNRGREFHVCLDDETAMQWLLRDELIQFSGG